MKLLSNLIISVILFSTASTASAFGFSTSDGFFDWDNDDRYYDRRPWGYDSRYRDSRRYYYDDWDRPAYKPPVRDSFYQQSPRSRYRDYDYRQCPPCECNCNKAEQKTEGKKAQNKTEAAPGKQ